MFNLFSFCVRTGVFVKKRHSHSNLKKILKNHFYSHYYINY